MWCKNCKKNKPEDEFYPLNKRRWKVTFCDSCAHAGMKKYYKSKSVGKYAPRGFVGGQV